MCIVSLSRVIVIYDVVLCKRLGFSGRKQYFFNAISMMYYRQYYKHWNYTAFCLCLSFYIKKKVDTSLI